MVCIVYIISYHVGKVIILGQSTNQPSAFKLTYKQENNPTRIFFRFSNITLILFVIVVYPIKTTKQATDNRFVCVCFFD